MLNLITKYGEVKIMTLQIEEEAEKSLRQLTDQPFTEGKRFVIMPDVHAGKGCVIGFTGDFGEYAIPNIVGVDIGCGMYVVELGKIDLDLPALDTFIKENIPHGRDVNDGYENQSILQNIQSLKCHRDLKDVKRIVESAGSLGGGNHFIEIDQDDNGNKYLVIHSGSRNLGKQVAEHYQDLAYKTLYSTEKDIANLIAQYKAEGRHTEINDAIKNFKKNTVNLPPKDLCYLTDANKDDYIHDMRITQSFAALNRRLIAEKIVAFIKKDIYQLTSWNCTHNYIGDDGITRKGAVSARKDEKVIIPISMKDGCIIGTGKGSAEWNYSAPHGAGRKMSRRKARETISVDKFDKTMTGIFTTTANESTIDEHPDAYKSIEEITSYIDDTVKIEKIIKPIYNFKASE